MVDSSFATLILIFISIFMVFGLIMWFLYLIVTTYYIIPNFLKGVLYLKDGKRRIIWLRKQQDDKGKEGIVCHKKYGDFSYSNTDVFELGRYKAIDLSEGSFKAMSLSIKNMQLDAQRSLHPKILKDILNNKLVSELLPVGLSLEDYLLIAILIVVIISGIYLFYSQGNIQSSITGLEGKYNLTETLLYKIASAKGY